MRDGALSNIVLVGRRPDVMPRSAWLALVLLASVAGVVLVLVVVPPLVATARRLRTRDRTSIEPVTLLLGLGTAGYSAAYLLAMATRLQVYDRYALPLIALVALALAWSRPAVVATAPEDPGERRLATSGRIAAVLALGGLVLLGVAYTADSASYDSARWRAAEAAVRAGWPARTVNGGFEWRNYHRGDKLPARDRSRPGPARELVCVTVHVDPPHVPGGSSPVTRSRAPTRATARVVAFRTAEPCTGVRQDPTP